MTFNVICICMQAQLAQMGTHLDVRVYRRVARELWNAAAGVNPLASLHSSHTTRHATKINHDMQWWACVMEVNVDLFGSMAQFGPVVLSNMLRSLAT